MSFVISQSDYFGIGFATLIRKQPSTVRIMADHRNFSFLISSVYCQMPPNTRINLIKRSHKTRLNSYFEEEVQDCKDGSRL